MAERRRVNLPAAKKKAKLGQNFLADRNAASRIVDALGDISQAVVLEIGPGKGALTDALVQRAGRLIAIELDRMLATELRYRYSRFPTVEVLQADAFATDFRTALK